MSQLTIYQDNYCDATVISNRFIDEFMTDANDAQLKIYLYILRMTGARLSTSVSDIADKFNYTEKDVIRALKFWEKKHIISLEYDSSKSLSGIHLFDLSSKPVPVLAQATSLVQTSPSMQAISYTQPIPATQPLTMAPVTTVVSLPAGELSASRFEKPNYSLDQLKEFKTKENTAQLLFIAEQYFGRPLTATEMKSVLFLSDKLRLSDDLIDYLIEYCVERGKKDFHYIEKVAINWAEAGISTPKQAASFAGKYDKTVYTIMNALGKSSFPTPKEVDFIKRWSNELAFDTDVILEACSRTVLATDKHRFEYADGILSSWHSLNVHHLADITKLDAQFATKQKTASTAGKSNTSNKFNQFSQNDYDFASLEKELLSNSGIRS